MRFDSIIIGGGLAGLTAGIRLAEAGQSVALISGGGSALHFNSGSLGLLGFDASHSPVSNPVEAVSALGDAHPYKKLGTRSVAQYADDAAALLQRAGVATGGNARQNHQRLSPLGILRPAWLTLDGLATLDALHRLPRPHVAIAELAGFLDFYPRFIASSLEKEGFRCEILTVDNPDLQRIRLSATEMRANNIARLMHGAALARFADSVRDTVKNTDAEAVILPAVVDFRNESEKLEFRNKTGREVLFAPTMGMSVPGIAMHYRLSRRFLDTGGQLFTGHRAVRAEFRNDALEAVYTDKLDDEALRADHFVFAGGSFFGRGLVATPERVVEPVLGLDTLAPASRSQWFDADLFGAQPLMNAGIATDDTLRAIRGGRPVRNLFAVGAALAEADALRRDCGAGVAMFSALAAAHRIIQGE